VLPVAVLPLPEQVPGLEVVRELLARRPGEMRWLRDEQYRPAARGRRARSH